LGGGLAAEDRARILDPHLETGSLTGTGGRLRVNLEDFQVWEIPAYAADGREGAHLLFTLQKRGWTSEDALRQLAQQTGVRRGEFGLAGLKDRHAVTEQWISAPHQAAAALEQFHHDAIQLGARTPHSNKLRRGHLRGNRFRIVLRELECEPAEALERAQRKLDTLARDGMRNHFGVQRFGREGANVENGLAILSAGRKRKRADLLTSAGQSALFNLYLELRREHGHDRKVLAGDVLKKRDTGGLFICDDPNTDQQRLDAGELGITGPMFGNRTRSPPPGSASAQLEDAVMERAGVPKEALAALGRGVSGTRRPMRVPVTQTRVSIVPSDSGGGDSPPALQLDFALPAGSYATVLLREIMS
jgi:tRNA pseudouridine13 synthase